MKRDYLKRVGKQGRKTAKAVAEWKRKTPPNHQGYWVCYICEKWVDYLMAEHVEGKARHPSMRTDHDNLKPTCAECNEQKGSKDLSEL